MTRKYNILLLILGLKEERDHTDQHVFSPSETAGFYITEMIEESAHSISDMKETLHNLEEKLQEKRLEAHRPDDLTVRLI